jgi:viroplasmin and RNaseH domain-containing protein
VAVGREIGIFKTWRECDERVNGVSGYSLLQRLHARG